MTSEPDLTADVVPDIGARAQKVAGGAALVLGSGAVQFLVSTAYHVAVARRLGAGGYGLVVLSLTLSTFLSQLALLGLDWGVLRYGAIAWADGDHHRFRAVVFRGIGGVLLAGGAAAALLAAAATAVSSAFDKPALGAVLVPLAIAIPFTAGADLAQAAMRVMGRSVAVTTLQNLLTPAVRLGAVLVAFTQARSPRAVGLAFAGGELFVWLLTMAVLLWQLPRGRTRGHDMTGLYRFSFSMLLNRIVLYTNDETEVFVLGFLRTSGPIGIFGVAKRLSLLLGTLLSSTALLFNPMVAELHHQGKRAELGQLFSVCTRWLFSLGIPICLVEVLFARDVVRVFGGEFESGAKVLAILALGQLVNVATGTVGGLLAMVGESRLTLLDSLLFLGLSLVLDLALIPPFGLTGAAIANATAVAVVNVLRVFQVRARLGFRVYDARFLKPVAAGAVAGALSYVLPLSHDLAGLAVRSLALLVIYLGALLALGVEPEDRAVARTARARFRRE